MDNETYAEASTTTPIVCTLTDKDAAHQALEWVDLQHRATDVEKLDGGVRMTFAADMLGDVEDLAQRERACCVFLTIDTALEGEVLTVDITSNNPDALPVIAALSGLPL